MDWDPLKILAPFVAILLLILRKKKDKRVSESSRSRKVPVRRRDEGQGFQRGYEPIEPK